MYGCGDLSWKLFEPTADPRPFTYSTSQRRQCLTHPVNQNMIVAAALIAAIRALIVYAVLQRQFISGLALGSAKG